MATGSARGDEAQRPRHLWDASFVNEPPRPRRTTRRHFDPNTRRRRRRPCWREPQPHRKHAHDRVARVRSLSYQSRLDGGDEHGLRNPLVPAAFAPIVAPPFPHTKLVVEWPNLECVSFRTYRVKSIQNTAQRIPPKRSDEY